jgi:DNA-binding NtrC family response regulator
LRTEIPELKVIFTSGYTSEIVGSDFTSQRGLKYLQKPYDPRRLALVVRECLDA